MAVWASLPHWQPPQRRLQHRPPLPRHHHLRCRSRQRNRRRGIDGGGWGSCSMVKAAPEQQAAAWYPQQWPSTHKRGKKSVLLLLQRQHRCYTCSRSGFPTGSSSRCIGSTDRRRRRRRHRMRRLHRRCRWRRLRGRHSREDGALTLAEVSLFVLEIRG